MALFDPLTTNVVRWFGPKFKRTHVKLLEMRSVVQEFNKMAEHDPEVLLCLGIFGTRATVAPKLRASVRDS